MDQNEFDLTIGRLDRVLSVLVNLGRISKKKNEARTAEEKLRERALNEDVILMDDENQQTLKHHAEDMIAAGQKILKDLGKEVQGTPQPEEPEIPYQPVHYQPPGQAGKNVTQCGKQLTTEMTRTTYRDQVTCKDCLKIQPNEFPTL